MSGNRPDDGTEGGTEGLADDAPHLLVVDDDSRIRELLSRFLRREGFRVSAAGDANEARRRMDGLAFDLLVVDVMMPGETGTELVADLRGRTDVPVLMLTALGETDARIRGLEAGADDYLPKPFDPRELLLRVRSILKRARTAPGEPDTVRFGPFRFDLASRDLRRDGAPVHLTEREREIVDTFARAQGGVVPRAALAAGGASEDATNERTVDVQMNRLRRKLEDDPANPVWLQTVRGVGYRLHIE